MVFFNCNTCGESIKKNQVEKHYQTKCRSCNVLSCVDCGKDFWGEEYKEHTKCVTEDEKYGGKGYQAKPGANKGERKQEEWTRQVQAAIEKCSNLKIKDQLRRLEDYPNIPRKKAKFENFLKNSVRVPVHCITQMWDAISAELNKPVQTAEEEESDTQPSTKSVPSAQPNTDATTDENTKKLSKKELKEERKRERKKVKPNDENVEEQTTENEKNEKRKNKKRKREENGKEAANGDAQSEDLIVKKKKRNSQDENVADTEAEKVKFNWETVIFSVLETQDDQELSVKRLRKKVLAEYFACFGDAIYNEDKLLSKFNKKISKNPKLRVLKDRVRLVS